ATLGPSRGGARGQRRLARVGEAEKTGVGDETQVQPQPPLLALPAGLGLAGRAVAVGEEGLVALPPAPAVDEEEPFAIDQHLAQLLPGGLVGGHRAGRNRDEDVGTAGARAVGRPAVLAAFGAVFGVVAQGQERVLVGHGVQEDAAAVAAVTPVGAA